jgi:very-short-patch-repair endonuclease
MTDTMTLDEYHKRRKVSELEALFDYHWEMFSHNYLDIEQPEHEVGLIDGADWRCDRVWRKVKLVVEVDGGQRAPGGGRHNTDDDRDKVNMLTLNGWRVLRYSGEMLKNDPHGVMLQVVGAVMGIKQPKYYKRLRLPKRTATRSHSRKGAK